MNPITNVVQLRQLLAERFPRLRFCTEESLAKSAACWPTGLPQIDDVLSGGLPHGAVTELVSSKPSSGSALLSFALLCQAHHAQQWAVLVDGADTFDPAAMGDEPFQRFLWVRCHNTMEALQASDLLLRDGNLTLVILDLRMNPAAELRKISSATWHRFQRLLEPFSTALFVITPHALVANARARLELTSRFSLEALDKPRSELLSQLKMRLVHHRSATVSSNDDELLAQVG